VITRGECVNVFNSGSPLCIVAGHPLANDASQEGFVMSEARFEGLLRALGQGLSRRGALAALGGLGLAAVPSVTAAKSRNRKRNAHGGRVSVASAPEDVSAGFDVPFCLPDFVVHVELRGKGKTIELPGEREILTSPGLKATLTNVETEKQVTLTITGATHQTTRANGDVESVVTGNNIVVDPRTNLFVLTRGRFTFVLDEEGNVIQELSGDGQVTDICELLS
jgi:hypothetical protein